MLKIKWTCIHTLIRSTGGSFGTIRYAIGFEIRLNVVVIVVVFMHICPLHTLAGLKYDKCTSKHQNRTWKCVWRASLRRMTKLDSLLTLILLQFANLDVFGVGRELIQRLAHTSWYSNQPLHHKETLCIFIISRMVGLTFAAWTFPIQKPQTLKHLDRKAWFGEVNKAHENVFLNEWTDVLRDDANSDSLSRRGSSG